MSKTDASLRPLVGVLRFDLPAKSTRTLSATQAYDTSRSQIVLGSFTGKLTDKTAKEKSGDGAVWSVALTATLHAAGLVPLSAKPANLKQLIQFVDNVNMNTVSLNGWDFGGIDDVKLPKAAIPCQQNCAPDGVTFTGTAVGLPLYGVEGLSSISKATNANTTYYGAITVGLGEYKKWQGNYAVLKINTVTEKAVLRIYAD